MLFPILLLSLLLLSACGDDIRATEAEIAALNEVFGQTLTSADYSDITREVMTPERREKYRSVSKVFTTPQGDYAFISRPVAYNGPVTVAVGIQRSSGKTLGMRIVDHMETRHYVRDMDSSWFTGRFTGKTVAKYLEPVHLQARHEHEIVIITGATVTTKGIINGVNACMGIFREHELGQQADAVPYMVRFERDPAEGPQENGMIAIRSYGVVLGEVSLQEIRQMPSVLRTMSIHSTSGVTRHQFRGTLLSHVIAAVDPELLNHHRLVMPVGVDDYTSHIDMEEVKAENSVFIMYEDYGEPLPTLTGEPGSMRVVLLDDVFGQRFTNYMIEIVLE